jgi:hypothetical protein
MPGFTNTWFPNRGALMVCWAAISLMTGPGVAWAAAAGTAVAGTVVAWAAGPDRALAAVATTSPAVAIAAVMAFLCFNARHSFYSARRHIWRA